MLPDSVKSAKLTAEWEAALKEVERGERFTEDFMGDLVQIVSSYEDVNSGMGTVLSQFAHEVIGSPLQ